MGDADRATAGDAAPGYRVKARRGQSTNPRSLTERERRAKITQNLKALHELIPGANQTVRSSMLDEINEYIKLLQQRVKDLSRSKLGGAGALGPLTVNVPVEGSGIQASTAVGEAAGSLSPEAQEFEKTVLKYMETDMKAATAYLESKGFYLIPIAQATPISDRTGKPGLGSPVTDFVGTESSSKFPASQTIISSSGDLGMGSAGLGSDLLLRENRCIEREREVPTPESIEDLMIISSLRKTMEKE